MLKKKASKLLERSVISVIFRQIKAVSWSVCCQWKGNQVHSPAIKLLSSCSSAHFKQGKKLIKKLPSSGDCCSWLEVRWTALPWGCNTVCWRNPSAPELSPLPRLGRVRVKARTVPSDVLCHRGDWAGRDLWGALYCSHPCPALGHPRLPRGFYSWWEGAEVLSICHQWEGE